MGKKKGKQKADGKGGKGNRRTDEEPTCDEGTAVAAE
jgi:hypothetical protein